MRRLEQRMLAGEYVAKEQKQLEKSWARHAPEVLDQYLVSGYQNPRINAQSILARHYLIRRLFGDEFNALMKDEVAFCVEANDAIRQRAAELGVTIQVYTDPVKRARVAEVCRVIADREDTFEKRWREVLADRTAKPLKVLEFACGSANDYRFFDSYGLAKFLDYTGVDLNRSNIDNARKRFPGVRFEQGSILGLPYESGSFDYVIAFDIFEHLSLRAMEHAMAEAVRVAREGFLVAFFIMVDQPEHTERPKGDYHWNELSAPRVRAAMEKHFGSVDLIHVRTFLAEQYGFKHYYNVRAWSLFADGRGRALSRSQGKIW
jgi:ubiquinone/menaquinone biosynthesis C-methylase UbiE